MMPLVTNFEILAQNSVFSLPLTMWEIRSRAVIWREESQVGANRMILQIDLQNDSGQIENYTQRQIELTR